MGEGRLQIRRGRRTDFTAVMALLAHGGMRLPPADRRTLRRFRLLVADLGTDFYVAMVDGTTAGLVHVTYARQLTQGPAAALDRLVVAEAFRGKGIGRALLAFAQRRARKRGCATFSCALPAAARNRRRFLERSGLAAHGEWFVAPCDTACEEVPPPAEP
jgi:GNAT superfamily N-acetyltransferase